MSQRTLIVTGIIAALSLILAAIVIIGEARSVKPRAEGLLFPGLQARLPEVSRIAFTTSTGSFNLESRGDDWVMPEKDGYPVDIEAARQLVSGLAAAVRAEAKTAEPALYARIGVGDPGEDAMARQVTVYGDGGAELASLIIGKRQSTTGGPDIMRTFARISGEPRSWLVTGLGNVPDRAVDWLRPGFVSMAPARVMSVAIEHPEADREGRNVTIEKSSPDQRHFTVRDMPDTHELRSEAAADVLGNAFAALRFEDVTKAESRPADLPATIVTARSFDGLVLALRITGTDGNHWATVEASVDEELRTAFEEGDGAAAIPASPDVAAEAEGINARFAGWAFRLPRFQALDLLKYEHSFIEPKTQAE